MKIKLFHYFSNQGNSVLCDRTLKMNNRKRIPVASPVGVTKQMRNNNMIL